MGSSSIAAAKGRRARSRLRHRGRLGGGGLGLQDLRPGRGLRTVVEHLRPEHRGSGRSLCLRLGRRGRDRLRLQDGREEPGARRCHPPRRVLRGSAAAEPGRTSPRARGSGRGSRRGSARQRSGSRGARGLPPAPRPCLAGPPRRRPRQPQRWRVWAPARGWAAPARKARPRPRAMPRPPRRRGPAQAPRTAPAPRSHGLDLAGAGSFAGGSTGGSTSTGPSRSSSIPILEDGGAEASGAIR